MQVIQLESAARLGVRIPSSIGADEACASRAFDEKVSARVRSIFNTCDEYRYAGSATTAEKIGPEKRTEVLQTLKEFELKEQSHAVS
jgi:hypothetical protein